MSIIMNNKDFVAKAKDIATYYNTVYANGTLGQLLTNDLINSCAKRLPRWYTKDRINYLRTLVGKNYYAFDCCGTIKAILYGWDRGKLPHYGQAGYPPDTDELTILKMCTDVSTNFKNIPLGAYLWVDGHCGLYIGNSQAIECTPKWQNKVQITNVANLGNTSGNARTWTKWGKLPWVDYQAETYPPYIYEGVDYKDVFDSAYYCNKYDDLRRAFGADSTQLFKHFTKYGMKECRQANEEFNVITYKNNYADLRTAYGDDYPLYYYHYCRYGKKEGRVANMDIYDGELKPIDEIAKEVIAGKWGVGEERKRRLTNAGYDYKKVQQRVNELLR